MRGIGQGAKGKGQREGRRQRAERRGQRAERRRQNAEGRRQNAEGSGTFKFCLLTFDFSPLPVSVPRWRGWREAPGVDC
jgi:hypothetical protein